MKRWLRAGLAAALLGSSPFVPALAPLGTQSANDNAGAAVAVTALPGDAEVEAGRGVLVTAEFLAASLAALPGDAELVL